ncbi:RHS repeat-associated core domain-containing protein, partial [Sulfurovum sp.]|uniref:RHS repeat-associated core domain-containing protein n=1 Tax=Sulfurovum sp. TaxID=1969726 RepID=UPI0035655646
KGKVYEHLEYFPFGETFAHEHSNTQVTPYRFTGKELDEVTGLYYYGARYYDPRTSVWQSPDPILDKYMSGKTNGGVFNPKNLSLFAYTYNNPINSIDPTGESTVTDYDGNVQNVNVDDMDNGIYRMPPNGQAGPMEKMGESQFMDSFQSPETGKARGKIMFGKSIEEKVSSLFDKAKDDSKLMLAIKSAAGEYDIKSEDAESPMYSYNGYKFKDKYISVRDAGNILAGMNAKSHGVSHEDFQKTAGALQGVNPAHGAIRVLNNQMTGATYGSAPKYGENKYQYLKSLYGYSLDPSSLKR